MIPGPAHLAAAGPQFLDGPFHGLTSFACALLNPAIEFFVLALGILKIVISELGPLLFQLAFGNVPIALGFECCHNVLFLAKQQDQNDDQKDEAKSAAANIYGTAKNRRKSR